MRHLLAAIAILGLATGCGPRIVAPPVESPPPPRQHIPGIAQMNLEELSRWVERCAPYNASPEARARNPYDPEDCDAVQRRHSEWRIPQTQKPATYLPGLH